MLQQERGKYEGLLPCAGITLIRFNGFDLSLPLLAGNTPRNLSCTRFCGEQRHKDKFFYNCCNISVPSFVLLKTLL